jgi:hypothetical protein
LYKIYTKLIQLLKLNTIQENDKLESFMKKWNTFLYLKKNNRHFETWEWYIWLFCYCFTIHYLVIHLPWGRSLIQSTKYDKLNYYEIFMKWFLILFILEQNDSIWIIESHAKFRCSSSSTNHKRYSGIIYIENIYLFHLVLISHSKCS